MKSPEAHKMYIDVINLADNVTEREARAMTAAISLQITQHHGSAYGSCRIVIEYVGSTPGDVTASKARGRAPIAILNHADQANALGYHEENDGVPDGKVFTNPVLENGGTVLGDPLNPGGESVSTTLSHEALELVGDEFVNGYSDDGTGRSVAQELCDAVEAEGYVIPVADPDDGSKTVQVCVSDFVLPEWFNPQSKAGPWSYLDRAPGAFQMTAGGYLIVRTGGPGTEQQVFAMKGGGHTTDPIKAGYPAWKLEAKRYPLARTMKRRLMAEVPPVTPSITSSEISSIWVRLETYLTLVAGILYLALQKGLIPAGKLHDWASVAVGLLAAGGFIGGMSTASSENKKSSPGQEAVHTELRADNARLRAVVKAMSYAAPTVVATSLKPLILPTIVPNPVKP